MKYLLFSGSLRKASLNKKLISVTESILKTNTDFNNSNDNIVVEVVDLQTLNMPVYDGDIEANGIPQGVVQLGEKIQNADALIISAPEYNGSIAGSLKNCIDWVSRLRPVPLESKPILLLGASPGAFGAVRGVAATRIPLEKLGAFVYPQPFTLSKAHEAFDENKTFVDPVNHKRLTELLIKFKTFVFQLVSK